ncbi:MAG: hypothetical protein ABIY55_07250 [Kofleriaceae bacterium]
MRNAVGLVVLMLTLGAAMLGCGGTATPRAIEDCSPQILAPGGACAEAGQRCWGLGQTTCSEAQTQTVCECTSGTWACAPAVAQDGDPVCLASSGCLTEGHVPCDDPPPADRHCQCDASGATWSCHSICDGCPDRLPSEGAACSPLAEGHCQYAAGCCTCVAGAFHCDASC